MKPLTSGPYHPSSNELEEDGRTIGDENLIQLPHKQLQACIAPTKLLRGETDSDTLRPVVPNYPTLVMFRQKVKYWTLCLLIIHSYFLWVFPIS
jgi:hypothetical protein